MNKYLIPSLIFILIFLPKNSHSVEAFKAEYKVLKAGKEIGKSSIELTNQNGEFQLLDKTKGTHGMASFLGFKRTEESSFTQKDSEFLPKNYQMKQKVAFNQRQSEYSVNEESINGKYKDKKWTLKAPKSVFTTPNLVKLNLARDVCAGKTDNLSYQVIDAGKVKTYAFEIESTEEAVVLVNKIHSKPNRVTKTWLDTEKNCLPVKTYHVEKDEDVLETELTSFTVF